MASTTSERKDIRDVGVNVLYQISLSEDFKNISFFIIMSSNHEKCLSEMHQFELAEHVCFRAEFWKKKYWKFLEAEKIIGGWKFLEAESFSRLKLSRGWMCLPVVLRAESFSRLKVSWCWNCLGAESVSQLLSGLRVSPDWKFLSAESFSGLKMSQGWKFLRAENVSGLKLWQLKVSHSWKCLSPSWLKVSGGWKCLGCKFLADESVSGLKLSSRRSYICKLFFAVTVS